MNEASEDMAELLCTTLQFFPSRSINANAIAMALLPRLTLRLSCQHHTFMAGGWALA
jgi:hypothetical protein